jgi:uncharacterized protein DUF3185
MKTTRILGIGLLLAAGAVGYMGYSESQGLGSALSSTFEGTPGDSVLIKYAAAAVLAGLGVFLIKK